MSRFLSRRISLTTYEKLPVEHIIEPVRGYRIFQPRYDVKQIRLTSPFAFCFWSDEIMTAECGHRGVPGHVSPTAKCTCGLYAFDHPNPAMAQFQPGDILAVVEAAGKIIMHELGFRAQRMRIVAIAAGHYSKTNLAANYPSSVVFGRRDKMLKAYPPQ